MATFWNNPSRQKLLTPEVVAVAERSDTVINETGCQVKVLASRVDVINVTMTLAFARHK